MAKKKGKVIIYMEESKNRKIPPRLLVILPLWKEGNENPFGFESSNGSNLLFCLQLDPVIIVCNIWKGCLPRKATPSIKTISNFLMKLILNIIVTPSQPPKFSGIKNP